MPVLRGAVSDGERQRLRRGCRRFGQSKLGSAKSAGVSRLARSSLMRALRMRRHGSAALSGGKEKPLGSPGTDARALAVGRRARVAEGFAVRAAGIGHGPAGTWQSSSTPRAILGAYGKRADVPLVIAALASRQIRRYGYSLSAEIY